MKMVLIELEGMYSGIVVDDAPAPFERILIDPSKISAIYDLDGEVVKEILNASDDSGLKVKGEEPEGYACIVCLDNGAEIFFQKKAAEIIELLDN